MCVFHLFEPISNTFDKIHHPHSHQILLLPRYVDPTKLLVFRLDIRTDSNLLSQEGHISGLGERFNDVHMVVCIHLSICSNLRNFSCIQDLLLDLVYVGDCKTVEQVHHDDDHEKDKDSKDEVAHPVGDIDIRVVHLAREHDDCLHQRKPNVSKMIRFLGSA